MGPKKKEVKTDGSKQISQLEQTIVNAQDNLTSINFNKLSAIEKNDLGRKLGETLLREISLPVLTGSDKDQELLEEVPSRDSLKFQKIAKDNPVKRSLAVVLEAAEKCIEEELNKSKNPSNIGAQPESKKPSDTKEQPKSKESGICQQSCRLN